jgi:ferredoxin
MRDVVFCYSSTGNSMFVAKAIALGLGDTRVVMVSRAGATQEARDAVRVGLVFPVIGWGLPRTVAEFVRALDVKPGQYVFAVATCGGTAGATLLQLARLLRAKRVGLAAGYLTRFNAGGLAMKEPGVVRIVKALAGRKPLPARERLPELIDAVRRKAPHRPERSSWAANAAAGLFRVMMKRMAARFREADRNLRVDETCTKCRTCVRVCPRGNVALEGGAHTWRHDCEMCMACVNWCPVGAMRFGPSSADGGRRHNPDVTAAEMMVRA